jgi:enoyl-CoA hydratase/carnithine racemase
LTFDERWPPTSSTVNEPESERPMGNTRTIVVEADGPVARVTLDDPARRNVLGRATLDELRSALTGLPAATEAVVLGATGPVFSAGHDLAEMRDRADDYYDDLFAACTELMLAVRTVAAPVIARVHGPATAAGCQLVASCDLAVAADTAWFATPGVRIGLFCSTPMVPITRLVGPRRALQMLLTGEPVDAATALEWGLVNVVVPPDALDAAVDDLVGQIVRWSPRVVALGKQAFYAQLDEPEVTAYATVEPVMAENAAGADAQEGVAAFLDKRTPRWPREG